MFKKKMIWMIIFVVLVILTIWAICSHSGSFSWPILKSTLKEANQFWLTSAVLCVLLNIFFEGRALEIIINSLTKTKCNRGILYSSADIYFSAITPSSSGGQPASAFFMIRDGISAAETTVVLLLNLVLYSLALVIAGISGLIICPEILDDFSLLSRVLILLGYLLLCVFFVGLILMLKKENWIRAIVKAWAFVGSRFHLVNNKERLFMRADYHIAQYRQCADKVKDMKWTMVRAMICNLLQRFSMIGTTLCLFIAINGFEGPLGEIFSVQTYSFVGSFGLPIPGSVGAIDYLMLDGFSHIEEITNPANFEILSRSISFYCCIALSLIITILGYYITNRDRGEL